MWESHVFVRARTYGVTTDRTANLSQLVELPARARRLFARAADFGLEPNALQVLAAIDHEPGQTVGELAQLLALSPSTVSHALRTLAERRLVRDVEVRGEDRRRRRMATTAAGGRLIDTFAQTAERL